MAKANNLKTKETEAVVVAPEVQQTAVRQAGTATVVSASTATLVQTSSATASAPSNFILVRAARSESGQLILQNGHELLSLLNASDPSGSGGGGNSSAVNSIDESTKQIVLQATTATHHQRIKGRSISSATDSTNSIAVQPIFKSTTLEGATATSSAGTIFLQSGTHVKKGTLTADGSIILQQRLKSGNNDGPILLQTLKRLDKTPSILVIRNAGTAIPTPTAATVTTASIASTSKIKVARNINDERNNHKHVVAESNIVIDKRPSNIPLGSGKYNTSFIAFFSFSLCSFIYNIKLSFTIMRR